VNAHRTVRVPHLHPGKADVEVLAEDGQVYPAAQTVTIMPDQTTEVTINAGVLWETDRREDGAVVIGYKGGPGSVTIPTVIDGLPVIGIERKNEYNFGIFYEKNVSSVTIPSSIAQIIGDWAFAHSQLSNITIPPNIGAIGWQAFYDNRLTSLIIPLSVTFIGGRAFAQNRLTSVTISSNVYFIGHGAFTGDQGLREISVAAGNPSYVSIDGVLFSKDRATLLEYPGGKGSQYVIPNNVTSIGDEAFTDSRLTAITISSSVSSIGTRAFAGNQLSGIDLPSKLIAIGSGAFESNQLTRLVVPSNVTSIGERAFADNLLTSVTIPSKVGSIDRSAFAGNRVIKVTIGSNVELSDREEYPSFPNGFDAYYKNNNRRAGTYTYANKEWSYRR
jgi:hypothetical protein